MNNLISIIVGWSEVWALFIPLIFLEFQGKQPAILKPVIIYLWAALVLNVFGDFISDFKRILHLPSIVQSNNPVYNFHSLVRFACFSYFFLKLPQSRFVSFRKALVVVFILFFAINFIFFEDFFLPGHLSGNLLSAEAYVLLVYCMLYYLAVLLDDTSTPFKDPVFWVVTGLSIYLVINFFVFLFYVPMIKQDIDFVINIWNVHNLAYLILCIFITRAFYANH
jgi:hypothetical protein